MSRVLNLNNWILQRDIRKFLLVYTDLYDQDIAMVAHMRCYKRNLNLRWSKWRYHKPPHRTNYACIFRGCCEVALEDNLWDVFTWLVVRKVPWDPVLVMKGIVNCHDIRTKLNWIFSWYQSLDQLEPCIDLDLFEYVIGLNKHSTEIFAIVQPLFYYYTRQYPGRRRTTLQHIERIATSKNLFKISAWASRKGAQVSFKPEGARAPPQTP